MSDEPRFAAGAVALLWIPILPVARAEMTHVDLDADADGYRERLIGFLRSALAVPELRGAVEASRLAGRNTRARRGGTIGRAKPNFIGRPSPSVVTFSEMTGWPTPFGLLD